MLLHPPFPRPSSAFVGRSEELRRTQELLPVEVLFLVYGIAGIGKSEFVYQAIERARQHPRFAAAPAILVQAQSGQRGDELLAQIHRQLRPVAGTGRTGGRTDTRAGGRRRGTETGGQDEFGAVVRLLDEEARPVLLFLDDLHLLSEGAGRLLGQLGRYVRSSRVFAAARVELALPAELPIPVVIRLPPLSTADAASLSESLTHRLGLSGSAPSELIRQCGGSPLLIRQALHRPAGLPDSAEVLAETLADLSDAQRQVLLLGRLYCGRLGLSIADLQELLPDATTLADEVRELARRFLIELSRGVVAVSEPLWDTLLPAWPAAQLAQTRHQVATLLLVRFFNQPQRRAQDGIEAVKLLLQSLAHDQALTVLRQMQGPLRATGPDPQLLDLLDELRPELYAARQAQPDDAGRQAQWLEAELLLARLLLRRGDVARVHAMLEPLRGGADVARSAPYLRLLAEVYQRLGRLAHARPVLLEAESAAQSARERFHIALQQAQLLSLSGQSAAARQILDGAGAGLLVLSTADRARLQGARALSWNLEERTAEAAAAAALATGALGDEAICLQLALQQILAQTACDQIEEARGLLDRVLYQAASTGTNPAHRPLPLRALLRGIVLGAEGDLIGARPALHEALSLLEAQQDYTTGAVAGYHLARTLLQLGDLEGARAATQRALTLARTGGTAVVIDHIEVLYGHVLLHSLAPVAARTHVERVLQREVAQPSRRLRAVATCGLLRARALERILGLSSTPAKAEPSPALLHTAADAAADGLACEHEIEIERSEILALAEDLAEPELAAMLLRVERARQHYAARGRRFQEARAALALTWLLLCRGQPADLARADEALGRTQELCAGHAYGLLHLRGLLLEAALQRRQGNGRRVLVALRQGLDSAGAQEDSLELRLLQAALREAVGARAAPDRGAPDRGADDRATDDREAGEPSPQLGFLLTRIGLRSEQPYEIIDRSGRREGDEVERRRALSGRDLVVELERGLITRGGPSGGAAIVGRPLMATLLAVLLSAPDEGASAEHLFCDVWGGRDYHPLQHRNTIYVAIGRLRQALRDLLPGREVIETAPGGWRLAPDIDVCAIRKKSRAPV